MMAMAEARAAWQWTANRCFIQEEAKRASKLACFPSSSSLSKPQNDMEPCDTANVTDHSTNGFALFNLNPSNSNTPPDTKWWLQLQPSFGYLKDFTHEQLNDLEAELLRARYANRTASTEEDSNCVDTKMNTGSPLDPHWNVSATCMKLDTEVGMQEPKTVNSCNMQHPLKHKGMGDWCQEKHLMDLDTAEHVISKQPQKLCFEFESPWLGSEKVEPWWRTSDKDELASLVAQRSLEHIENCDLPRPQISNLSRCPSTCLECFNHYGFLSSSLDMKKRAGLSIPANYAQGSLNSGRVDGKQWSAVEVGDALYGSDKPFRGSNNCKTTDMDPTENQHTSESDPSKAQLLEALCHSQTRAREAEKAAQQAYDENEHIIKLFFRQASELFAYKHWFQLLQLETLCLQLKNTDLPITTTLFPMVFPWIPYKNRLLNKARYKAAKWKQSPQRRGIYRYAIMFAAGLGLVGAGLLLGWTMGLLLSTL